MGQALYRKYRTRSLDEIVGQSHITDMLRRAIKNDTVVHAYLLTGPRGVGKTSIARILAHEINSLPYTDEATHLDIIEIDAASNNSVEDIRDLRDKVMVAPTSAKYKVYIIDEVHMLSKSAFNALLKTLEEPPAHVIFILATTDADKLPATILSRVQRFNFRLINTDDLAAHLRTIADMEKITIDDDALQLIAREGRGSFRDSISLLDQLQNLSDEAINTPLIESVLGLADEATVQKIIIAYREHNLADIVTILGDAERRGMPATILSDQLILSIRRDIAETPELLTLLDRLLEVNKSVWPHVKLLTALTADIADTPPSRTMPTPELAAPSEPPPQVEKNSVEAEATMPKVETPTSDASSQPFPWTDFLTALKKKSSGAYSLLSRADHDFDGHTLVIYAGKAFHKKQIDRALPQLSAALSIVGVNEGTIDVRAEARAPKDSQTAVVLDIMGGGEEVSL